MTMSLTDVHLFLLPAVLVWWWLHIRTNRRLAAAIEQQNERLREIRDQQAGGPPVEMDAVGGDGTKLHAVTWFNADAPAADEHEKRRVGFV